MGASVIHPDATVSLLGYIRTLEVKFMLGFLFSQEVTALISLKKFVVKLLKKNI